uniref:Transmembrane protein 127 transmembrane region domain-containing protein n=1 Tax=Trichuris muris TaxID=70415 RepID=A0A5S6QP77_TRIMR
MLIFQWQPSRMTNWPSGDRVLDLVVKVKPLAPTKELIVLAGKAFPAIRSSALASMVQEEGECASTFLRKCCHVKCSSYSLASTAFGLLAVAALSVSLAEQDWFYINGGHCPLKHLGLSLFYGFGYFEYVHSFDVGAPFRIPRRHTIYRTRSKSFVDCVTPEIVDIFHALIGVIFITLMLAFCNVIVSACELNRGPFRWIRTNSVFNVFLVFFCVFTIGISYWVSLLIENFQRSTTDAPEMVHVSFGEGFYLIVAAACFFICAFMSNIVKYALKLRKRMEDRLSLIENSFAEASVALPSDLDLFNPRWTSSADWSLLRFSPAVAPPPYTP